jgi:hypothetical protein
MGWESVVGSEMSGSKTIDLLVGGIVDVLVAGDGLWFKYLGQCGVGQRTPGNLARSILMSRTLPPATRT